MFGGRFAAAVLQVGSGDRSESEEQVPPEHDRGAAAAGSGQNGGGEHTLAVHQTVRRLPVFHQRNFITMR